MGTTEENKRHNDRIARIQQRLTEGALTPEQAANLTANENERHAARLAVVTDPETP